MSDPGHYPPRFDTPPLPDPAYAGIHALERKRGVPWWGWVLIVIGLGVILICGGVIAFIVYAAQGPDTFVYPGNQLPQRFIDEAEDAGIVDANDNILYFYSDGIGSVEDAMYLVTDEHVGVHMASAGITRVIPFDDIADAQLTRDTSFFIDSLIFLQLKDGTTVEFPVSSEHDRDERFFEVIEDNIDSTSSQSLP